METAKLEMIGLLDIKGQEQVRRVYHPAGLAPTLTTCQGGNRQVKILDLSRYSVRKLTPLEYGRLQGFDMSAWVQVVSDSQAYKQFGNAVTVPLFEAIAEKVKKAIGKDSPCFNDFFCGCGGLGTAFIKAGFKHSGAWDFDKYAVQSYRRNVHNNVEIADIREMGWEDIPNSDTWSFGFPCQDLSIAGKHKGLVMQCEECGEEFAIDADTYTGDTACPKCGGYSKSKSRSGCFFEIMRLLDETMEHEPQNMPAVILAENVKGIKPYLGILEAEYKRRGYTAHIQMFNSKYWGVAQNRERFAIVGTRDDLNMEFKFPEEQHDFIPLLSQFLESDVEEKYYIPDDKAKTVITQALERLEKMGKVHPCITPDWINKRQNGRRAKEDEAPMFTLTAQDIHGIIICEGKGYLKSEVDSVIDKGIIQTQKNSKGTFANTAPTLLSSDCKQVPLVIAKNGKIVTFDDVAEDDNGHQWACICKECVEKYGIPEKLLDEAGQRICGVEGCENEADFYIDFPENEQTERETGKYEEKYKK